MQQSGPDQRTVAVLALERVVWVSGVKPDIILTSQSPLCQLLAGVVLVVVRALQLARGGDRVEASNSTEIILATAAASVAVVRLQIC